ncbi:MAG: hypothetical protein IPM51_13260 [Sphingobacteriaceae bacterium]|nr:hypothetical protein [Sphingobacteriaceae bacterium]
MCENGIEISKNKNKKLLKLKKYSFLFLLLCLSQFIFSQIYPVQISTQLIPPYSGYLPDYASPGAEKLKLILQFNDFSQTQYNIKLQFEIKGNGFTLKTKSFYNPAPITLIPGQPLLFTSVDLAPYLNSSNLDFLGINQSQYEQRMSLPEGYYSICVKAFDYNNAQPIQVSNEACAQAWFTLSDPPFLNFPLCNSTVKPLTPQNILFQWTPMNLGSPNSGLGTSYEFSLFEFRPDTNANPNQVVQSTRPIFTYTTNQTFFNYSLSEPNLNLYQKYIWRVRAMDNSGRDYFKNEGYSQICTFRYGSVQNVIGEVIKLELNAHALSHRSGQCYWNKQSAFTQYLLQVRKQGTEYWFDYENVNGIERILNLEEGTVYEARVRGEGNGIQGEWSNTATFKTEEAPQYSCNDPQPEYNTAPPEALASNKAIPGLIFQSGQFEVSCIKIQSTGSEGWYKGEGYVKVFGKRIRVKWDNIYIDVDGRMQQGTIDALTDGIDQWLEDWDLKVAEQNAHYTNGEIDTVFIKGNQICYTFQGSAENICIPFNPNSNITVVRDGEGNEYIIQTSPPPPKVKGPFNYLTLSNDSLAASDSMKVEFLAADNQKFGMDIKQYAAFIQNYEVIPLKNKKKYFVANKSIGVSSNDEVIAVYTLPENTGALTFKTKSGEAITVNTGPSANTLRLQNIPADAECIYAWYNNKKIGKLNIHALEQYNKKVVVVPVNGTAVPENLQAQLNAVYKQSNTTWSLSVAPNFTFDLKDGKLESADAGILSKYSEEMRALRTAYREKDTAYDKEALYLFIVNEFTNAEQLGYMARGKAMGFIKSGAVLKTIAHELGHGAFGFDHTFPTAEKASTNNLMDYGNGIQMVFEQWMQTKISPEKFNWFDEEEDGSFWGNERGAEDIFKLIAKIKLHYKKGSQFQLNNNTLTETAKNCFLGGSSYDYIKVQIVNLLNEQVKPRNKIIADKAVIEKGGPSVDIVNVDDKIKIAVPPYRIQMLINYLKDTSIYKNLLVFVNGYRPTVNFNDGLLIPNLTEYVDTENKCEMGDCRGYWKGLDARFINRIGTKNVVYFDGHHSVKTSNHESVSSYLAGNILSDKIRLLVKLDPINVANNYKFDKSYLHTKENISGFKIREASGAIAASNLISKINTGDIIFNKEKDTVDVVAHSMGYAYSVGLIKMLKIAGFKFGRYYILAPENACSGGVELNMFTEVWQYGSNLGMQNEDPPWLQDGVAPQCNVQGIGLNLPGFSSKRIEIPREVETKSYLGSHSIGNYYWIFNIKNVAGTQGAGYVKKRN